MKKIAREPLPSSSAIQTTRKAMLEFDERRVEAIFGQLRGVRDSEIRTIAAIADNVRSAFDETLAKLCSSFKQILHGELSQLLRCFDALRPNKSNECSNDEPTDDIDEMEDEIFATERFRSFAAARRTQGINETSVRLLFLENEALELMVRRVTLLGAERTAKLLDEGRPTLLKGLQDALAPLVILLERLETQKPRVEPLRVNSTGNHQQPLSLHSLNTSTAVSQVLAPHIATSQFVKLGEVPALQNPKVIASLKKFGPVQRGEPLFKDLPEEGPLKFGDGSIYVGQMKEGRKHGWGRLVYPDGSLYEGYWKEDVQYGFGRLIRANGDVYEGLCKEGKANGVGLYAKPNGYVYKGEWFDDKMHGTGEEIWKDGTTYVGGFVQGKFEGKGVLRMADGTVYEGDFLADKFHGNGSVRYSSGEAYQGAFEGNLKQGHGAYNWPDGRIYQGTFDKDLPNGFGLFQYPDGLLFRGWWKDGLQHGIGEEVEQEGGKTLRRIGEWVEGKWKTWRTDVTGVH
eukprot:TRINITY_DN4933_c0_g1_i1.p1 TRINITY_DN4933_c0_g1~~TRINITY_DN4933_c0_g1_i1.p1  ORF type:complete len:514 (-),score=103.72 TRINITY_DN4933_c0_g1_i1:46-1587(-)